MKNFKNSGIEWLGEIPEHWEISKFKYFYRSNMGETILVQDLEEDGFPVYSATEDDKFFGKIKNPLNILNIHDFVIPARGNSIGSVKIVKEKSTCTQTTIFSKKIKKINSYYVYYFLLGNRKNLFEFIQTAIPQITINQVNDNPILLPPLKEQEQIANFLDEKCEKIQNFIKKKEKLLSLLQEQKQALINETITKGLDKNVKLKNSGIEWLGEIPEHWEVRKLKMLFSFGNGLNITKADFISFGIPCISYGEIHSKYPCRLDLSVHKLPFVSETYLNDKPQSLLSKGDFVFADTSEDIEGSGNFTYIQSNIPLFAGYHTIILRPKTQIYSLYFSFLFDSIFVRNQIREKVWGVKVFSITKSILKEVQCFIPPLKEQEQIANFLDEKCEKIDSLITKIKKQIELIKEYKTTLINEAVCGRMDLNKG
ncbi:restriction endonuclease subunit S [Campylobacter molothri]|uniref:Restriction endonuclease subunit S n=1 Tax=Campylobacter molothri TaxID=1032242 RepID=A0ACC5VYR8_9BACT|nr:restriction endonuclease subunit S [Campylobacter sp. RM9754]